MCLHFMAILTCNVHDCDSTTNLTKCSEETCSNVYCEEDEVVMLTDCPGNCGGRFCPDDLEEWGENELPACRKCAKVLLEQLKGIYN